MNLSTIITQLRTYCPTFVNKIAGAAEFQVIPDGSALALPCAYVLPLDDSPGPQRSANGYRQELRDGFAVVVRVANKGDERGQAAMTTVYTLRAEIFKALLAWQPSTAYGAIEYDGGNLLQMNRAVLDYQLEFSAVMELDETDTWLEPRDAALDAYIGSTIQVDAIDPFADPNLQQPGPDGRIEWTVDVGVDPLRDLTVAVNPNTTAYNLRHVELVAGEALTLTVSAWTAVAGFNDAIQFVEPSNAATLSLAVDINDGESSETSSVVLVAETTAEFYDIDWPAATADLVVLTITSDTDVTLGIVLQGGTPA